MKNYFTIKVKEAPEQLFECDTTTSGDRVTGSTNSVKTKACVQWTNEQVGLNSEGSTGGVWGDDVWWAFLSRALTPDNVVAKMELWDKASKRCGQLYTQSKAFSGRMVHYLQNVFIGGQTFARPPALDHENWQPGGLSQVGSLLDKLDKMSVRNGRRDGKVCNIWRLSYLVCSAQVNVFGKTFVYDSKMFLCPGGLLNRVLLPFASPNSKVWLSMNAARLFNRTDIFTEPPKPEQDRDIGARIWRNINPGSEVQISGLRYSVTDLNAISKSSFKVLSNRQRVQSADLGPALNVKYDKLLKDATYNEWNTNVAKTALGSKIRKGPYANWFLEEELIQVGIVPDGKVKEGLVRDRIAPRTKNVVPRTEYGIGDYLCTLGYSGCTLTVRKLSDTGLSSDYCYEMVDSGSKVQLTWGGKWHPFFLTNEASLIMLNWLGTATKKHAVGRPSDALKSFSPSKFRPDLTPKGVVEQMRQVRTPTERALLLRRMGFLPDEVAAMDLAFQSVGDLTDIEELEDFSSSPNLGGMTSACTEHLNELFEHELVFKNAVDDGTYVPGDTDLVTRNIRSALLHLLTELIYTEINITCNYTPNILQNLKTGGDSYVIANLPEITITKRN
uniref:RdRp n=1 Tax=viral metagenome TaxID=1070528 RepID=A0A2V0RI14_9ZZZZ